MGPRCRAARRPRLHQPRSISIDGFNGAALQSSAETVVVPAPRHRARSASMGPRCRAARRLNKRPSMHAPRLASMGPRCRAARRPRNRDADRRNPRRFNGAALQSSAETDVPGWRGYERPGFNGAALQSSAETGRVARPRDDMEQLQWGRAAEQRGDWRPRPRCRAARRPDAWPRCRAGPLRFNGAALQSSAETSVSAGRGGASRRLQWGRAAEQRGDAPGPSRGSVAVRCFNGAALQSSAETEGFNGPGGCEMTLQWGRAAEQRGDSRSRVGPTWRDCASMGPRCRAARRRAAGTRCT